MLKGASLGMRVDRGRLNNTRLLLTVNASGASSFGSRHRPLTCPVAETQNVSTLKMKGLALDMGFELWTSPVTGYRRRGTRANEFRALFEKGLTVSAIYEPLRCCKPSDLGTHVREELERLEFDVVGVRDPDSGSVIGWVPRDLLKEDECSNSMESVPPGHLVSDSTPLMDLLEVLASREWAFVVAGHGITGIVTRADLLKPPVRALLFGLLSLLEIHLTYWVGKRFPDDSWTEKLSDARLELAKGLQAQRVDRNEEITLLDCLQLCDKRDLVVDDDELRERLGLGSKREAERFLSRAQKLRDRVAHAQEDIVGDGGWQRLADTIQFLEQFLMASDREVEVEAQRGQAPNLPAAF